MVAVPILAAVTSPVFETEATPGLSVLHVTFLFVASGGSTVAVSCSELPTAIVVYVIKIIMGGNLPPINSTSLTFSACFFCLTFSFSRDKKRHKQ